jgi:hypothetical protein
MTAPDSVLVADDYVVRYGLRGFCGALVGLLLWTALACMIAVQATRPSISAALALGAGEIGLLAACTVEVWRAARRDIVFAVSQDGVYFGPGAPRDGLLAEAVPWEQIGAVELSTQKAHVRGILSPCRCVGVLDRADEMRIAYRRMSGWRINTGKLGSAVRQYAPWVPVIDDQDPRPIKARCGGQPENA